MKKILLFMVFCGLLCGQEVKQKEKELQELQAVKVRVEATLQQMAETPLKVAQDKVNRLDKIIKDLPDRQPTKAGNITMKQHLQNMKAEIEKEPAKYIQKEVERLINVKDGIDAKIQMKAEEISNEKIK